MEAAATASVPPPQPAALSAQTPPKKNAAKHSSKKKITGAQKLAHGLAAAQPMPQTTSYTTRDSQNVAGAAAQQASTSASQPTRRPALLPTPQTLPAVQDFLQKAYDTVQRSHPGNAAAPHNPLDRARAQPSPILPTGRPQNAVTTQSSPPVPMAMPYHPPHMMISTAQPSNASASLIRGLQPSFQASAHSASKQSISPQTVTNNRSSYYANQAGYAPHLSAQMKHSTVTSNVQYTAYYANQSYTATTQMGHVSTVQTAVASNMGYSGYVYYNQNRRLQSNHSQAQDSQRRSILVAKRRSPTVPKIPESSETGTAEKTQKPEDSNVPQQTSSAESSETSEASVSKETESTQTPNTQTEKTSSAAEKPAQSPKKSPAKYNTSRVAVTYQASKAFHGPNGPQNSAQAPKKTNAQNAQSNAGGPNGMRRPVPADAPEPDPRTRVLVSGFPPYTQSQDLIRVLKTFGPCQVERCRNRLAVVTFNNEAAVKSAIKASDELCIYGEFLEITNYTNSRHVEDLFRAYKKIISTQKGQDIIQPSKIDLSGDFHQQLKRIQATIRLSKEQVYSLNTLYDDLERALQAEWPGCVAIPFGSIPTGLGILSSDVDCYVDLPPAARQRGAAGGAAAFVLRARRLLATHPRCFAQLVAIPRANTPIVKFRHLPTGFHCDVSSKTPLGAQNSKLIKLLLDGDERVLPVAVILKYWAKVHELTGTGRLTNYALTMMVVFYMQQPHVGLAPSVASLQADRGSDFIVDHWNAGFSAPAEPPEGAASPTEVSDLLGGFFEYYAKFDFDHMAVCPFLGRAIPKALFEDPTYLPVAYARYAANVRDNLASPIRHNTAFCVQDPFEQSHNVASSVSAKLATDIRAYFQFAAEAYAADRPSGCASFLRTVLLQRPKIRRERTAPTTKVFLIPRIRAEIVDPDWRARVRETVLGTIFERILKVHLTRDREREAREALEEEKRDAAREEGFRKRAERRGRVIREDEANRAVRRVEREKYSGAMSKPVWRRRKNYSMGALEPTADLVQRQSRATDQIINAAANAPLEFHLELGFRDQPRHCYVHVRLVDGDLESFRGFVGFLHSIMFDWFRILMRPYFAPHSPSDAAEDPDGDGDGDADGDADEGAAVTIRFETVDDDDDDDHDEEDISSNMRTVSLTEAEGPATDAEAEGPAADVDSSSADSSG